MASSAVPTTPENKNPRRAAMNRSFTLPPKLASNAPKSTSQTPEIGAAEGIETLYTHPNANVVKFTAASSLSRPASSSSAASPGGLHSAPNGGAANLPWTSPTERTLAAGALEIYRVPGSVSFLHSGSLLHAIMPRSQCWCVDGVGTFAFRVLADTYYRIELPGKSEQDLEAVDSLKATLEKVLWYERTPCPFARRFTVDLPEEPEVRVTKRRRSHGPAKKWRLEKAYSWKPEGQESWEGAEQTSGSRSSGNSEDEVGSGTEGESGDITPMDEEEASELADEVKELGIRTPTRPRAPMGERSVSAPVQTTLQSGPSPSRRFWTRMDADETARSKLRAEESRMDAPEGPSTRTVQAIPTDMPPSPPDSSVGVDHVDATGLEGHSTFDDVTTNDKWDEVTAGAGMSSADHHDLDARTMIHREDTREDEGSAPTCQLEAPLVEPAEAVSETPPTMKNMGMAVVSKIDDTLAPTLAEPASEQPRNPDVATAPSAAHPTTPPNAPASHRQPSKDDPFAAIQARILARRSLSGTTTYSTTPPPRQQSPSDPSKTTGFSHRRPSPTRRATTSSALSPAMPSARLLHKACAAFLGPPAHLAQIMLRIAARFASGAFGVEGLGFLYVESPVGVGRRVPGSFFVDEGDEIEDDFGVRLRA